MKCILIVGSFVIAFLLCISSVSVFAQGTVPPPYTGLKNPFPWKDISAQEKGKESYAKFCSACHGPRANTLFNLDSSKADYWQPLEEKPDLYFWILSEGTNKGMPGYKTSIPEDQRWQILTFLRSLSTASEPSRVATPAPISKDAAIVPPKPAPGPDSNSLLDCLGCHKIVLQSHDKLGSGNNACWSCHYSKNMSKLTLAGGNTQLPLSDSTALCGQCHQERYKAWNEGTHGVPELKALSGPASGKLKCVDCHKPHQPQIVLSSLIKPHPAPAPPPPAVPTELLAITSIALLVCIFIGIGISRKGQNL